MKTVSHEEIMKLKYADRETVPGLERHADGACVHIGPISPACMICFIGEKGGGIQIGQECMYNCPECYYKRGRKDGVDEWETKYKDILTDFFRESLNENWKPFGYSYQSTGETLLYIDKLMGFGPLFRSVEKKHGINIYHTLYTNGVLIDEEMLDKIKYLRIKEIRFHVSASDFSDEVFKAMELVRDNSDITLSVEEPAMPHRRDKILEYLPVFHETGVKHLNLIETQVTRWNKGDLESIYPGDTGRIYKEWMYHLYDEGMVYEVMRERQKNNYGFSVLDCNSHVESYRNGKFMPIGFTVDSMKGMCAPFDYGQKIFSDD
jgi:pyruvate formate-lyase activating enzyme-like uncharacterized protein